MEHDPASRDDESLGKRAMRCVLGFWLSIWGLSAFLFAIGPIITGGHLPNAGRLSYAGGTLVVMAVGSDQLVTAFHPRRGDRLHRVLRCLPVRVAVVVALLFMLAAGAGYAPML